MDTKTAEGMLERYLQACKIVREYEAHPRDKEEIIAQAKEERDMLHAFALSAIKSLTPARGFTV